MGRALGACCSQVRGWISARRTTWRQTLEVIERMLKSDVKYRHIDRYGLIGQIAGPGGQNIGTQSAVIGIRVPLASRRVFIAGGNSSPMRGEPSFNIDTD